MAKKKDKATEKVTEEFIGLNKRIEAQANTITSLQTQIDNLHHQATGYDAVIDFLWHKLQER